MAKVKPPKITPTCIECGEIAHLTGGEAIYPHRPDLFHKSFYKCVCGAYCGCHPGTTISLGFPCGALTRGARNKAHALFDPLWKNGGMRRGDAYKWLAERMGIDREDCHIGRMTAEQAKMVVSILEECQAELLTTV